MNRDLTPLFDPASIAVIGASADPAKWGNAVAVQALRGRDRRPVHLVNRRGGTLLGRPCVPSVEAIDGEVALAVIAVPEQAFEQAVDAALGKGARAIVAITAGIGETGPAGRAREQALLERVRAAGALLVGPNCLGLADNAAGTYAAANAFAPGDVALLSQSGNLAIEIDRLLTTRGLGISRFVSLGNQADITLVDLVATCAADPATRAIAVYVEDFRDGRGFVRAAAAANAAGTPVVVMAACGSSAVARGARSHTGALTSDTAVVAAACEQAGAIHVQTPRELADALLAVRQPGRAAGRRLAVLTDGGGHGVIAAAAAEAAGLTVPELGAATQQALRAALGATASVANPVDLAGAGEADPASYARAFAALQASGDADAVLLTGYFGGYASGEDGLTGLGSAECAAAKQMTADSAPSEGGKAVAVHSIFPASPSCRVLADAGLPVFAAVEDAVAALAALARDRDGGPPAPLPAPAAPVAAADYMTARGIFAGQGVPFPRALVAHRRGDVRAAAATLRPPYVLKALGLLHKSDAGGVVVGLADEAALLRAHAALRDRLDPPAFSVEEMADLGAGVELIIGARWDARFGPVVLAGMGGTATEVLCDVAVALAPVDPDGARRMLRRLRTATLLGAYRGRAAVDLGAVAAVITAVSRLAAAHPDVAELEINPLLATPSGAVALDARIVTV